MKILNHIVQAFKGSRSNPQSATEYVPCETVDWREPLLIEAARKHGKPFKCAGDELPREIILGGKELIVVGAETRMMHGSAQATVARKRVRSVLERLSDPSILGQRGRRHEVGDPVIEKEFLTHHTVS